MRNVIVTHKHMDHAGGLQALLLARVPLDIYANADTHAGIRAMTAGSFPEWKPPRISVVRRIRTGRFGCRRAAWRLRVWA